MAANDFVVDLDLFKNLDQVLLAEHVFPEKYSARHKNVYAGRKLVVEKVIAAVKELVQLKVHMCPKEWTCKRFSQLGKTTTLNSAVNVARCNLACKKSCLLYCSDCYEENNTCSPVAMATFDDCEEGG
jgi:hypothetical protein